MLLALESDFWNILMMVLDHGWKYPYPSCSNFQLNVFYLLNASVKKWMFWGGNLYCLMNSILHTRMHTHTHTLVFVGF